MRTLQPMVINMALGAVVFATIDRRNCCSSPLRYSGGVRDFSEYHPAHRFRAQPGRQTPARTDSADTAGVSGRAKALADSTLESNN